MIQAEDYRAKAEDCARRAEKAQDEYHRKNFEQLAAMWAEMADKTEGRVAQAQREVDDALATIQRAEEITAEKGN